MRRLRNLSLVLLAVFPVACCCDDPYDDHPPQALPVPAEIEVEVYDPVSNGVWEGVGVRVVEAYQEWSGCICGTTRPNLFLTTDRNGLVYLSPTVLAEFDVGFALDTGGRAILSPRFDADQAVVTLEVFADGFQSVLVDVPLSWDQPYAFVAVPFE